jgi:hypothetical protein
MGMGSRSWWVVELGVHVPQLAGGDLSVTRVRGSEAKGRAGGSPQGRHAVDLDDAAVVLPPLVPGPGDQWGTDDLWQPEDVAVLARPPAPRRNLAVGMVALTGATVGVCAYAAGQLVIIGGLGPPSPPRYVLTNQPIDGLGLLRDPLPPGPVTASTRCDQKVSESDRAVRCDQPTKGRHRKPPPDGVHRARQ